MLSHVQHVTKFAIDYENEFVNQISDKSAREQKQIIERQKRELSKAESRYAELNTLFKRIYEDNVSGKLSDERFALLSSEYETEQNELKTIIQ